MQISANLFPLPALLYLSVFCIFGHLCSCVNLYNRAFRRKGNLSLGVCTNTCNSPMFPDTGSDMHIYQQMPAGCCNSHDACVKHTIRVLVELRDTGAADLSATRRRYSRIFAPYFAKRRRREEMNQSSIDRAYYQLSRKPLTVWHFTAPARPGVQNHRHQWVGHKMCGRGQNKVHLVAIWPKQSNMVPHCNVQSLQSPTSRRVSEAVP